VWRLGLGTDQDHVAVCALIAQRDGGRGASETCAEDHMPLGHYTSICRASPSTRVRYALTGTVAGGASTLPVRTSNSEPWHVHVSVVPANSPSSASEHCSCVHASSNA